MRNRIFAGLLLAAALTSALAVSCLSSATLFERHAPDQRVHYGAITLCVLLLIGLRALPSEKMILVPSGRARLRS